MRELDHRHFAASHGVLMNINGGFYQHGKSYGMDTKLRVATKYLEHNAKLGGSRPNLTCSAYHDGSGSPEYLFHNWYLWDK